MQKGKICIRKIKICNTNFFYENSHSITAMHMKYEYFVYDIGQTFYLLTTKKTRTRGGN